MKINDIYNLPVQNITADNCVLFLWVTFPLLKEGIETLERWGFTYKTCAFTWVKQIKKAVNNDNYEEYSNKFTKLFQSHGSIEGLEVCTSADSVIRITRRLKELSDVETLNNLYLPTSFATVDNVIKGIKFTTSPFFTSPKPLCSCRVTPLQLIEPQPLVMQLILIVFTFGPASLITTEKAILVLGITSVAWVVSSAVKS